MVIEYEISRGKCTIFKGTVIDAEKFKDCSDITEIEFPNNLKEIGENAFRRCTRLKAVKIPMSVEKIDIGAFCDCCEIESIEVDPDNPYYKSVNNCCLSKDGETLIFGCKSSIIPNCVKHIGDSAFEAMGLKQIIIPNSVISIGNSAFAYGIKLKEIILPENLESIGEYAFNHCDEIEEMVIPCTVTNIGKNAFESCMKLSEVEIPNSVTIINEYAFYECHRLTSVEIPCSVKEIKDGAFIHTDIKDILLSAGPSDYKALEDAFNKKRVFDLFPVNPVLEAVMKSANEEDPSTKYTSPYDKITLHVPQETTADYKKHPFFGRFLIVTR